MNQGRAHGAELAAIILVPLAVYLTGGYFGLDGPVNEFLRDRRSSLYPAIVGLEGSLLGFTVASLTIMLGYAGSGKLQIVRDSRHWPALYDSFTRSIRWTFATTVASVAALLFDREAGPNLLFQVTTATLLVVASVFVGRMLWVLQRVVAVVIQPGNRPAGQ